MAEPRCDEPGFGGIFARKRLVAQDPRGSVEVPLARVVEGLREVLQVVAFVLDPVAGGPVGRRREADDVVGLIELLDPMDRRRPGVELDHVHVVKVGPAADIARLEAKAHFSGRVAPGLGAVDQRLDRTFVEEVAPSGIRARASPAVDEKLVEVEAPGLHLGDLDRPKAALVGPPQAANRLPAAKNRRFVRIRGISDRARLRSGVFRRQHERPGEVVRAAANHDTDRLGEARLLQTSDCVPGRVERGQRSVGSAGVRLGQCSGPPVVTVGCHKKPFGRRTAGENENRRRENGREHRNGSRRHVMVLPKRYPPQRHRPTAKPASTNIAGRECPQPFRLSLGLARDATRRVARDHTAKGGRR